MKTLFSRFNLLLMAVSILGLLSGFSIAQGASVSNRVVSGCPNLSAVKGHESELLLNSNDRTIIAVWRNDVGESFRKVVFSMDVDPTSCADPYSQQLVARVMANHRQHLQEICTELRKVINGTAPVPVKGGQTLNVDGAREYVAEKCQG